MLRGGSRGGRDEGWKSRSTLKLQLEKRLNTQQPATSWSLMSYQHWRESQSCCCHNGIEIAGVSANRVSGWLYALTRFRIWMNRRGRNVGREAFQLVHLVNWTSDLQNFETRKGLGRFLRGGLDGNVPGRRFDGCSDDGKGLFEREKQGYRDTSTNRVKKEDTHHNQTKKKKKKVSYLQVRMAFIDVSGTRTLKYRQPRQSSPETCLFDKLSESLNSQSTNRGCGCDGQDAGERKGEPELAGGAKFGWVDELKDAMTKAGCTIVVRTLVLFSDLELEDYVDNSQQSHNSEQIRRPSGDHTTFTDTFIGNEPPEPLVLGQTRDLCLGPGTSTVQQYMPRLWTVCRLHTSVQHKLKIAVIPTLVLQHPIRAWSVSKGRGSNTWRESLDTEMRRIEGRDGKIAEGRLYMKNEGTTRTTTRTRTTSSRIHPPMGWPGSTSVSSHLHESEATPIFHHHVESQN
ncbi:hypothetical protein BDN72DRAFT_856884 [Pluteus cervinus]|uniref:Uncharacterized protein n=1 Tax=Pluteus cervinus TaxID=181527 RepID=A0ACD3AXI3_9AGAR|nr:hypothetical protein BDN72DRAFT_856884 [Pluteus cervinus]